MPIIGKERRKDKTTWLALNLGGFLIASSACAIYYFFYEKMFMIFRQTSYFQLNSIGVCFIMACVGCALLFVPVIVQSYKIASMPDKKLNGPEAAQLLTSGASPEFLMPSAI